MGLWMLLTARPCQGAQGEATPSEGPWRLPTAKGLNGVKEIWAESLSHHKEVR